MKKILTAYVKFIYNHCNSLRKSNCQKKSKPSKDQAGSNGTSEPQENEKNNLILGLVIVSVVGISVVGFLTIAVVVICSTLAPYLSDILQSIQQ